MRPKPAVPAAVRRMFLGLGDDVFRLDFLALQLGFGQGLLEALVAQIVVGLIAETALGDDQGDGFISGLSCRDRDAQPKGECRDAPDQ